MQDASGVPPAADARLVLLIARGWIGTPYARGASLRGVGCDCIGLARGVWAAVTGAPAPPALPWSPDWAAAWPRHLIALGDRHMLPRRPAEAGPGDLVAIRRTDGHEAHVGILAQCGRFIHATERLGVVEVPLSAWAGRIAWAASFPAAPL
ncbi:NlpC/P60 family protein [Amaricoccus sp.]|uniref:NlpC/P60 family protein n=1 Tax=Amaricoccus sp. TaxID=1872485 RepID=UPI001B65C6B1|nr:NlpC/P60 family protein [Amaricoccus sp.]MBP7001722.1 C40 family peptidase [Amaricoccus sp.]